MVFFIVWLGQAIQCVKGNCVPVPYEAVAYMIQLGFLELATEVSGIAFYITGKRKR